MPIFLNRRPFLYSLINQRKKTKTVFADRKKQLLLTLIIFCVCFSVGLILSARKPLWNDESFSQSQTIEKFSYRELFLGTTKVEGNKCPLFYATQKALCQAAGYRFPHVWRHQWLIKDMRSQILLRINPNFFMSMSIALLFFYFARHYSTGAGIYAVSVALSFFMVWFYWVDARPYAMWFFFSTVQVLLFLILLKAKGGQDQRRAYAGLFVTHILMAFTITIAVMQIALIGVFLWSFKERHWQKHIAITVVPVMIGLLYYFFTSKGLTRFFLLPDPLALLHACVPKGWLFFFVLYAASVVYCLLRKSAKGFDGAGFPDCHEDRTKTGVIYLGLIAGMYAAALLLLANLMSRIVPSDQAAHYIHERYFLFLVPVAIIGITLFSLHLWQMFKADAWMRLNIAIGLTGALVLAYLDTFIRLVAKHIYF